MNECTLIRLYTTPLFYTPFYCGPTVDVRNRMLLDALSARSAASAASRRSLSMISCSSCVSGT